jgi:hypothetical protein
VLSLIARCTAPGCGPVRDCKATDAATEGISRHGPEAALSYAARRAMCSSSWWCCPAPVRRLASGRASADGADTARVTPGGSVPFAAADDIG